MTLKRTTKALASRIQVDYLKKSLPFRYWKRVLLGGMTGLALLWVVTETWVRKKEIHAPGIISQGHKIIETDCGQCHLKAGAPVPNDACLVCHADLVHRQEQIDPPRCAECHVEHRGPDLIATVGAWNCASCHADLKRKDRKKSEFASGIHRVDRGHPEFRFLAAPSDSVAIKLNHKIHMKPGLEGAGGEKVTMKCSDCHEVNLETDPEAVYRNAPISYEENCKECHRLGFDRQFPKALAPHKKPEEVRQFLIPFYQEALRQDPQIFKNGPDRSLPGPQGERIVIENAEGWLEVKLAAAEQQLFGKACLECHDYSAAAGALPQIAKVEMQEKYLTHGDFDHAAHRSMTCAACHTQALQSEKSTDFLVPSLQVCSECHVRGGMAQDSCFECHRYHSEGMEKVMELTK